MNEDDAIDINIEQILAAILATIGEVSIPIEKLTHNYGEYNVSVNQDESGNLLFGLVKGS